MRRPKKLKGLSLSKVKCVFIVCSINERDAIGLPENQLNLFFFITDRNNNIC